MVRDLAADVVVDHRWEGWPHQVRDAVGGVDVVFDGVGGGLARDAFALLDRGGRMVSFGAASGAFATIDDDEAARRQVTVRPSRVARTPTACGRRPRSRSATRRPAVCGR